MATTEVGKVGLYLVNATAGTGNPGAPTLHLSLLVNAVTGAVTGQGLQTQAVQPPGNNIPINDITGEVRYTGLGKFTKIVALRGNGYVTLPPPAIGTFLEPFTAHFAIDNAWTGTGGWTMGSEVVKDAPIHANQ
jgi:hypothetical protein